jgi:hypothetical protein
MEQWSEYYNGTIIPSTPVIVNLNVKGVVLSDTRKYTTEIFPTGKPVERVSKQSQTTTSSV